MHLYGTIALLWVWVKPKTCFVSTIPKRPAPAALLHPFYLLPLLMELLVATVYVLLFVALLLKLPFFADETVQRPWWIAAFLVKLGCGFFFMLVYQYRYHEGGDALTYFTAGKTIYDTLHLNPLYFLELTFGANARKPPEHLATIIDAIPSWNDVRSYTAIRVNALAHLISFHYYSVHIILGTFLSFLGLTGIYRSFCLFFPQLRKWFFAAVFGLPSVLFWTSGLHKEGISLLCMGMVIYLFFYALLHKFTLKLIASLLIWCALLALIRPYTLGLLLPALVVAWVVKRFTLPALPTFLLLYGVGYLILSVLSLVSDKLNIFAKLAQVRYYFVMYKLGGSDINLSLLPPTWYDTLLEMPMSLANALLRPEPWGNTDMMHIVAATETLCLTLLLLAGLLFNRLRHTPFAYFWLACLFFIITSLLLIGLTTDNLGAIVRYRSILLPVWLSFWVVAVLGSKTNHKQAAKLL